MNKCTHDLTRSITKKNRLRRILAFLLSLGTIYLPNFCDASILSLSCRDIYEEAIQVIPGQVILVGEIHGESGLNYLNSRYMTLLNNDKIFLGTEGEFMTDRQSAKFGLESEAPYGLSLLVSPMGYLDFNSKKGNQLAIQRYRSAIKNSPSVFRALQLSEHPPTSLLTALSSEKTAGIVAATFRGCRKLLAEPASSWLLEIDPDLPNKIQYLEEHTRHLITHKVSLAEEGTHAEPVRDPVEDEIIVNLRNKIIFYQINKHWSIAQKEGKPIFISVGRAHIAGLLELFLAVPAIKVMSLNVSDDFSPLTRLLIELQYPREAVSEPSSSLDTDPDKKKNFLKKPSIVRDTRSFFKTFKSLLTRP